MHQYPARSVFVLGASALTRLNTYPMHMRQAGSSVPGQEEVGAPGSGSLCVCVGGGLYLGTQRMQPLSIRV